MPERVGSSCTTAIVLIGGGAPAGGLVLPPAEHVIAADSGLALARPLGLRADVVVGDLDSVPPQLLEEARAAGTRVEQHPVDKDRTDLELALAHAAALDVDRIVVVGGSGGRVDHHLANVAVLGAPMLADIEVVAHLGSARLAVCRRRCTIVGEPDAIVSLLPLGGPARGVTTQGLHWPLTAEDLDQWTARGVSNQLIGSEAIITLAAGILLVVQPEHHLTSLPHGGSL